LHEGGTVGPLFTSLASAYGSGLIDKSAKHAAVGDETKAAASLLHSFATSAAFDKTAYASSIDTARTNFANGNAAFLIDYRSAFGSARPKDVALAAYPKVDANRDARPMLGGIDLVVSSYSKHQKQAVKVMQCIRSGESVDTLSQDGDMLAAASNSLTKDGKTTMIELGPTLKPLITNGTAPLQTPVGDAVDAAITKTLTPLESIDVATVNDKLTTSIDDALHFTAKN